jgi:hypothetical protein
MVAVFDLVLMLVHVQVGRRSLLISGSILGLAADFAVAIVFSLSYSGGPYLPTSASIAAIVLVRSYSLSDTACIPSVSTTSTV